MALNLEDYVSSIPDFPKEGILFRDVTSIIQDGEAFRETINQLVAFAKSVNADFIVGPEARGFIFGASCGNGNRICTGQKAWKTSKRSHFL